MSKEVVQIFLTGIVYQCVRACVCARARVCMFVSVELKFNQHIYTVTVPLTISTSLEVS
jgi:hypothetical protein